MTFSEPGMHIETTDQLESAAAAIINRMKDYRVVAFYGEMGAGKTTLIKAICKLMGVTSTVSSPTFSLVNEYRTSGGELVFHFDFYRIKKIGEAFDMGYENYFFSGHYCFIEWPEMIESLMDFPHLKIRITVSDKKRIVTLHT